MNPTQSEQEAVTSQSNIDPKTITNPSVSANPIPAPVTPPSIPATPVVPASVPVQTSSPEPITPPVAPVMPPTTPVTPPTTPTKKQTYLQGLGDFTRFAAIVIVCVVVIRYFIAQPFIVSGASMVPNFASSDYLIVDEISYRFHPPERGDVIIFHPPIDLATYYIKRVIGMPGDTVDIHNGVVTITNAQYPKGVILSEKYITKDTLTENDVVTVPAGEYFVMGDNRPESYDSRGWGLLPAKNITGRALLRLFPISRLALNPGGNKVVGVDGSTL